MAKTKKPISESWDTGEGILLVTFLSPQRFGIEAWKQEQGKERDEFMCSCLRPPETIAGQLPAMQAFEPRVDFNRKEL